MEEATRAADAMLAMLSQGKARYEVAARAQCDVFLDRQQERHPLLLRAGLTDAQRAFPVYNPREIHHDPEKMLALGLRDALAVLNGGREAVPSVRANMGCGIVPALFGVVQELYEDKMPWVRVHLPKERLWEMTEADLTVTAEFRLALEHMEHLARRTAGSGCLVYPVDIQGAFDTAHLVYGDAIFYDLYDDPGFVHHLLDLSCAAAEMAFDLCLERMPGADTVVPHYNALSMPRALGGVKLSEDTSTLLSREQIDEFVMPAMARILGHCGGGYIHYCGRNPHLYRAVLAEPLVHALNFGNPDMHDMENVLADCAEAGKLYYGIIPRPPGEDRPAWYRRLLRAAAREGRIRLLLQDECAPWEVPRVSDQWDAVVAETLRP